MFNFANNLLFGIQTDKFMRDPAYRLFFDDALLFLREIICFTPDLTRIVYKQCQKFEVPFELTQSFMNFPLLDQIMFSIGERFSEKLVQVRSRLTPVLL